MGVITNKTIQHLSMGQIWRLKPVFGPWPCLNCLFLPQKVDPFFRQKHWSVFLQTDPWTSTTEKMYRLATRCIGRERRNVAPSQRWLCRIAPCRRSGERSDLGEGTSEGHHQMMPGFHRIWGIIPDDYINDIILIHIIFILYIIVYLYNEIYNSIFI